MKKSDPTEVRARRKFAVEFELEILFGVLASLRAVYGDLPADWRDEPIVRGFFMFTNAYALLSDILTKGFSTRTKKTLFKFHLNYFPVHTLFSSIGTQAP